MLSIGINASIADPQHDGLVDELARRGIAHVRSEIPMQAGTDVLEDGVNFVDRPLWPLFLLCGGHMQRHHRAWTPHEVADEAVRVIAATVLVGLTDYGLEIGNELDLANPFYAEHPERGAELVREVHTAVRAAGFTGSIYGGGTANLNKRGLTYLSRLLKAGIPDDVGIAVHRYPEANLNPASPHDGYRSRDDEWLALKRMTGNRPIAVTEVGYHQALHKGRRLSDDALIAAFDFERRYFEARGADALYWYSINDGVRDEPIDRYGIRDVHGAWKPLANVFQSGSILS